MAAIDGSEAPEGSQQQPIILDDDIDVPQSAVGAEVREIISQAQNYEGQPVKAEVDEDNLSEDPWLQDEAEWDRFNESIEASNLIDLTEDSKPGRKRSSVSSGHCEHWKKGIRNPCPCGTHYMAHAACTPDVDFNIDQLVELKESIVVGPYQAEFLEVSQIWYPHAKGDIFIRGFPYARTRNLDGRIDPRKNELCALLEIDTNDDRPNKLDQTLVEVQLSDIKTVRVLHKTNKLFPECRFDPVIYRTKEEREAKAPLTCRWVMTRHYPDARYRRAQRPLDGEELRHFNENDVSKSRHRASDDERLTTWRRGLRKVPGGSYIPEGAPPLKTEPESSTHLTKTVPGQKYSVVDVFCGAGGFSKGAEMAGFKILMACDHWSRCCETYRANFPGTELHEKAVRNFVQDTANTDLTDERQQQQQQQPVDYVHLSPPCQYYSPAHTCPGKNDKANILALFDCEYVVLVFRPRVFSVEQTFGLSQERHSSFFNAFVQGFTRNGFSVKWKVLHLVELGLAQTRKRLFVVGAAPGETLPDWPEPTNSKPSTAGAQASGAPQRKRPPVSAVRACSKLIKGWNLHDVASARPLDRQPWDGSRPLERTITTSGGQCYHWSGLRELTLAEFAALQGFPRDFVFRSKCIKKQIGNAFPPVVVKVLMKHIRNHLEKIDGVESLPDPSSVIDLDDIDDDEHCELKPYVLLEDEDDTAYRTIFVHTDEGNDLVAASRESRLITQFQSQNLFDDEGLTTAIDENNTEASQAQSISAPRTPTETIESRHVHEGHHFGGSNVDRGDWGAFVQRASGFQQATADSSRSSVTYVGESSLPGSSRQLPVIVEDSDFERTTAAAAAPGPSSRPVTPEGSGVLHGDEELGDLWLRGFVGGVCPPEPRHYCTWPGPLVPDFPVFSNQDQTSLRSQAETRAGIGDDAGDRTEELAEPVDDIYFAGDIADSDKDKGKGKAVMRCDHHDGHGDAVSQAAERQADAVEVSDKKNDERSQQLANDLSKQKLESPDGKDRDKSPGKEVRTFDEYDRGQNNESPKGRGAGGAKRYCGNE